MSSRAVKSRARKHFRLSFSYPSHRVLFPNRADRKQYAKLQIFMCCPEDAKLKNREWYAFRKAFIKLNSLGDKKLRESCR